MLAEVQTVDGFGLSDIIVPFRTASPSYVDEAAPRRFACVEHFEYLILGFRKVALQLQIDDFSIFSR